MTTYKININDNNTVTLDKSLAADLDLLPLGDNRYHLIKDNQSYNIQVLENNQDTKTLCLTVNGTVYNLQIEDEYDQLVKRLGLEVVSAQKVNDIKAPMPGLVLEVAVESGQAVTKGDTLLILEAMKMENVIKAPGDGTVAEVSVAKGAAVEKGALLIRLD